MPPFLRARAGSMQRADAAATMVEPKRSMSVRDILYGQIEFPPVIRVLTDSPIVQRLRDLKQLGNSFYVYPGATHSRFEHSLGVCYLGMELYRSIVESHREEHRRFGVVELEDMPREAAQKDMHCIGIAGLCHDLGHGPLSHLFESYVRASAPPGMEALRSWSHEQASIMLLRRMWADNETELAELGFNADDLRYVELLINGLAPGKPWPRDVGRGRWARFTTEIIANKRNGLDVDKIDYIQRDSVTCLGTPTFVSMRRLFQGARVLVVQNDETTIGFPDKLDGVIEELFLARSHLHRIVYQHRVTKIIDLMTLDALHAAGDALEVSDGGDRVMPLRSCVLDPDFYVHASDWIVLAILHGRNPNARASHDRTGSSSGVDGLALARASEKFAEARRILQRVQSRRLYTTIGSYRYNDQTLIEMGRRHAIAGSSQEVKREVMLHALSADVRAASEEVTERLSAWERAHAGLPAIEILQAEITQTAGDMDKKKNPVSATFFFNPRQSASCTVEPHLSCNSTTTMSTIIGPVSSLVVVCRMPLTPDEKELLRASFTSAAERLGTENANTYSHTPLSQRGRGLELSQRATRDESAATPPHSPSAGVDGNGEACGGDAYPVAKRIRLDLAESRGSAAHPATGTSSGSLEASGSLSSPPVAQGFGGRDASSGKAAHAKGDDGSDDEAVLFEEPRPSQTHSSQH